MVPMEPLLDELPYSSSYHFDEALEAMMMTMMSYWLVPMMMKCYLSLLLCLSSLVEMVV